MLAKLADLKTWLDVESSAEDELLTLCLQTAGAAIERYCQRTLDYVDADLTEYFDGGVSELLVKAWPIVSVISVKYASDYDFENADALTEDTDYRIIHARGRIVRLPLGLKWTEAVQCWQLVYRGGYADPITDPLPDGVSYVASHIQHACVLQAAHLRKRHRDLGATSEGLAGGAGNIGYQAEVDLLKHVKKLLAGERRV